MKLEVIMWPTLNSLELIIAPVSWRAIMSTRSRASFLLKAVCFILLASSASWLGGTQRWLCHAHGLPSQPCGVIHCLLLVRTLHILFKLVSQSHQTHVYKSVFRLLAFLATNRLMYGSYPCYGKYPSEIIDSALGADSQSTFILHPL